MQNPLFIDRAISFKLSVNVLVDKQAKAHRLHILWVFVCFTYYDFTSLLCWKSIRPPSTIESCSPTVYFTELIWQMLFSESQINCVLRLQFLNAFCFVFLVCFLVNNLLTRNIYSSSFSVILLLIIRYHLTLSWGDIFILRIQQVARQTHFFLTFKIDWLID